MVPTVRCITFGAPQIGDAQLAENIFSEGLLGIGNYKRVVLRGDIVPELLSPLRCSCS